MKNFRCFENQIFDFDAPVTLLSGDNGTGKTSILEAIHYICYMRSFRASTPRDLIQFEHDNFFVKASFETDDFLNHELQVGFEQNQKLVKLNKKNISSFKELMDFYRVITLVEDDLWLIKGGPDVRRRFLDQAILLVDNSFLYKMREFKKVLQQRNMLLQSDTVKQESYDLWTSQLWEKSRNIQEIRNKFVKAYEKSVNAMLKTVFAPGPGAGKKRVGCKSKKSDAGDMGDISVSFEYKPKKVGLAGSYADFMGKIDELKAQEIRFRRSLFGAHLDDFVISFQSKKSRNYASRGQQKLVVLLLKTAQLADLVKKRGQAVFLLDDFMTDFDEEKVALLANFLVSLDSQLIFTSPSKSGPFDNLMLQMGAHRIKLLS